MPYSKLRSISCHTEAAADGVIFSLQGTHIILPGQSRPVLPTDGHIRRINVPDALRTRTEKERLTGTLRAAVRLQSLRHKAFHLYPGASHVTT